jgi:RES domain-containing protein
MILPKVSAVRADNTHRLIPYRYSDRGRPVLDRIAEDDEELNDLLELEGATNDRLLGESGKLPGISLLELVSGFRFAHIVNATFTHAHPGGARFNDSGRGAWYAAFDLETSQAEVAFHRSLELQEIPSWKEEEISPYIDYVADFRTEFHDIRDDGNFSDCLKPDSYAESQMLGQLLLQSGSAGIVYPSVRRHEGTCLACFRPPLVLNVREGAKVTFTFANPFSPPAVTVEG